MPRFLTKLVLLSVGVFSAGKVSLAQSAPARPAEPIYSALAGAWVGTLEYRDYSSNKRVFLPMILDIRRTKDGASLALHYIYDDGPTKVAQDNEVVTIDSLTGTYSTVPSDGKETVKEFVTGLNAALKMPQGQIVRMGTGTENSKPVDIRTTMTFSPRTLVILKETRSAGGIFQFRDRYTLTLAVPAVIGK